MPIKAVTYLKLALTAIIWGGTFVAGRVIVQSMDTFSAAFCRFAVASMCLGVMLQATEGVRSLKRQQLLLVMVLGLSGIFAYNAFFFWGLKTISASRAALIIALNPIVIALGAAVLLKESLTRTKILGIVTSLMGAAIVISQGDLASLLSQGISLGDFLLFGCVISWAIYSLASKHAMTEFSPLAATTYACWFGTIALTPAALAEGLIRRLPQASAIAGLGIVYLGVLGSAVGFIWYAEGLRAIGAAKAAIFINLVPPSAVILAALLLHEPITRSLLIGGTLILVGVFWTNRG
jgi:drug/metabolite transporter (DMT)-like permease